MVKLDSYAATGRAPSGDPFRTRDALLGWMQDIAPYGLFTTDTDLVIRSWNQWLANHSGLAADAVIGRKLVEVFPDVLTRKLDEHFVRALHGEISVLSTALHKYLLPLPPVVRNYHVRHMLQTARIAPLPADDEIVGTITIIEDVTQRECQALILLRQQERDRLLTEALALLLQSEQPLDIAAELFSRLAAPLKLEVFFNYLLSPDGKELRLHAAGGITPAVRKEMSVLVLGESFCGQVALQSEPLIETHVQSGTRERAQSVRRLGLRSYAGFPLLIGDRLLGTLSFGSFERDVIAPDEVEFLAKVAQYVAAALERARREKSLREAQQRLHQHAGELETKIAERTAKLRDTIEQLECFSHTIAHDLRAPIRSLVGFTEILLADFAESVPEEGQELLRRLQRASLRLAALTRDLLVFSKIARQDVKLAPVDVDELVAELVAATPALQGVLIMQPPLGIVSAQRTLLQQCFSNLFDNALKFTAPGVKSRIIVRSELRDAATPNLAPARPSRASRGVAENAEKSSARSAAPREQGSPIPAPTADAKPAAGPRRRIWIRDNGIGIPPEAHEKIFGIFERIPGPNPVEGTGIGLAIVARATEQMGGLCGVESTLGEGSRFWLELATPPETPV